MRRSCRAEVARPKLALIWLPAGSNRAVVSTFSNWVWLNTLLASARNSTRREPIGKPRNTEKSTFQLAGPRNALRPELPHALPGWLNWLGSYHRSFGPASPKPPDSSPVTLIVC